MRRRSAVARVPLALAFFLALLLPPLAFAPPAAAQDEENDRVLTDNAGCIGTAAGAGPGEGG